MPASTAQETVRSHSIFGSASSILSKAFPPRLFTTTLPIPLMLSSRPRENLGRGMEGQNRRRRQNDPPQYANLDDGFPQAHLGRNFSDDRYRQPEPSSRSSASAMPNYGYYAETTPPFPATPPVDQMSYQAAEYAQVPRQLQAGFTTYDTSLNYGQFQPRQSPTVHMLSDTSSFYASESMGSIGMPETHTGTTEETCDTPSTIDQAYRRFKVELGQIFQHIVKGTLVRASELLMGFSEWLISHVEEMELTSDDAAHENARSKLWDDFNHAWLALMQKQRTSTEELLQASVSLQHPQLLSCNDINKMCGKLIKLNDEFLERHGLVNYQYGVLEDQIINSAFDCMDLLEDSEARFGNPQRPLATGRAHNSRG